MEITTIDAINKSVLISVFLLGLVTGGAISLIVSALKDSSRRRMDNE